MTSTQFELGFSTDLIQGLNPEWDPQAGQLNILRAPGQQGLAPRPVAPVAHRGDWSGPHITLHDDALSLLDELIPYHVVGTPSETDAPVIKAGALLCGAHDEKKAALAALSAALGVDLDSPDLRYALVKLTRVDGRDTHASASKGILIHARPRRPDPEYGIQDAFRSATARLPYTSHTPRQHYGDVLDTDGANRILDCLAEFGTHYVSAVSLGDTILQVFAYRPEQFATITKAYADHQNPLSGRGAENFAQFTTDLSTGVFGFVTQYGHVLNLSRSAVFDDALARGDWQDTLWSNKDSIFTPFNPDARISLTVLQQEYRDQVVTDTELASLGVMIEQKRALLWQRVFKAAMVQRYRDTINPKFAAIDRRDFAKLLPEDQPGVASCIATPKVNVYKGRLDLADMQFVAADEVRELTLFANVLSACGDTAEVRLPGDRIRLVAQIMDMRGTSGQPKLIMVPDSAAGTLEVACDEFLGAMALRSRDGEHFTVIVDGLRFALDNGYPVISADVRTVPPPTVLPDLRQSMQFSMAFAEAVLGDQSCCRDRALHDLVRNYLNWLAKFIPADSEDQELLALRVHAMALANYAANPGYGSFVPILPASEYREYVTGILSYLDRIRLQIAENEQRLAARRQQELTVDVAKTLNENIIASGQLISGIVDANAAQQRDLQGYYDSLIAQKEAEAEQQQLKLNELNGALHTARNDMDAAVQKYTAAVEQWKDIETIKFGIDVATNLFALGTTIANPASTISAVKELGTAVQMIQKTLNTVNALSKLYTGISSGLAGLQGAQKALDGLDGAQFGSPVGVNWDELPILFTQVLATGPDVKAEKAALQSAFSLLVLRGKAVTNAESALHQVQRDIYAGRQQKELNDRQAERWRDLQGKLNPADIKDLDKNSIDLMGMSGYLENIQKQMLAILAKAFVQHDLALQYANLQPPTPVSSFSLLKFSAAIVEQQGRAIAAKSRLARFQAVRTKPIEYVIEGVHPEQVTGGSSLISAVFPDSPEFADYVDARIVSVVADVDGVKETGSGRYHLRLAFNGTPFHDRDIERNVLTFRTPSRERVYVYNAADGSPAFSDGGASWSEGVSRVTPFSAWEISFPDVEANRGLAFTGDLLTIRLSFVLEARIVDTAALMRLRAERQAADDEGAADTAPLGAAGAAEPALEELIGQMHHQGSCTNGWDVVFNMGIQQINKALAAQYETLKRDTAYKNTIVVDTQETYPGNVTVINRFNIEYGYPQLTFSVNNSNTMQLQMEILKGTVQRCSKVGTGPEQCEPPEPVSGETLTAVVGLAKVAGNIDVDGTEHNVLKVMLNMAQGAFTISNITLSDATKVEFNAAVKAYFVNHPVEYLINQLDLTGIPTLDALKPKGFVFKPLRTPSSAEILQLFIMTGDRALLDYSQAFLNNVPEPLPLGQSSSMMIRSRLIFQDVLPRSLPSGGWTLAGTDPRDAAKPWSAKVTAGSVIGTVDLHKLDHTTSVASGSGSSYTEFTYSIPGGNDVSWPMDDTTLTAQSDGQLLYSGSRKQSLKFNEHASTTVAPCFWNCTTTSDHTMSTDFGLDVHAVLPLSIGGSGRDQTVQIATTGKSITVNGHLAGGGPCNSDDLAAQVNQQIRSQIPTQIANKLSFQFTSISVFALKNLLFPADDYISFSHAAIPGDLLLTGTFVNGTS